MKVNIVPGTENICRCSPVMTRPLSHAHAIATRACIAAARCQAASPAFVLQQHTNSSIQPDGRRLTIKSNLAQYFVNAEMSVAPTCRSVGTCCSGGRSPSARTPTCCACRRPRPSPTPPPSPTPAATCTGVPHTAILGQTMLSLCFPMRSYSSLGKPAPFKETTSAGSRRSF